MTIIEKACEEWATQVKELLKEGAQYISAFAWKQFTPSFNDGDACHFGIHGFYIEFTDLGKYLLQQEPKFWNKLEKNEYINREGSDPTFYDHYHIELSKLSETFPAYQAVVNVLKAIDITSENDILMQSLFDDPSIVIINADGTTEERETDPDY